MKRLITPANVNLRVAHRDTALGIASGNGNLEIVKFLCGVSGVDINLATDYGGWTPIHSACYYDFIHGQLGVVQQVSDFLCTLAEVAEGSV